MKKIIVTLITCLLLQINLQSQNNESGTKYMSSKAIKEYIMFNLTELVNLDVISNEYRSDIKQYVTFDPKESLLDLLKRESRLKLPYVKKNNLMVYWVETKSHASVNVMNIMGIRKVLIGPAKHKDIDYYELIIKLSRDSGISVMSHRDGGTQGHPVSQVSLSFNKLNLSKALKIKDAFYNLKDSALDDFLSEAYDNKNISSQNKEIILNTYSYANVYSKPNSNSKVIYKVSKNKVKLIKKTNSRYYFINVDGVEGYIQTSMIKND